MEGSTLGLVADSSVYNSFGELVTYNSTQSGSDIYSLDLIRDDLGRITSKTETIEGSTSQTTYTYDSAGRLIEANQDGSLRTYTYDLNSNRTSYTDGSGPLTGSYDSQDRLISYGGYTFNYNQAGELTTRTNISTSAVDRYHFNSFGSLTQVELSDGRVVDYTLDAQNRRVGKSVDGVLQKGYLYRNQLQIIAELDSTGNVVSTFIYGSKTNVPEAMIRGGIEYRILSDHQGSVRLVVNSVDGTVAQRMDYDEYGRVRNDTNPGFQPFGFAGGLYDTDTQLSHFGARSYDAFTGRWLSKDPILFNGRDTNLYGYVLSDPINYIDVTGQAPDCVGFSCRRPPPPVIKPPVDDICGKGCFSPKPPSGRKTKKSEPSRGKRRKRGGFRACGEPSTTAG